MKIVQCTIIVSIRAEYHFPGSHHSSSVIINFTITLPYVTPIVMVFSLMYSANCLKTIGQKAYTAPNFHHFYLGNVIRSKIIKLGIRKRRDYKMYRWSRGGGRIFHQIYILVNQVQQRSIQVVINHSPQFIDWDHLLCIQQVKLPKAKVTVNHCALINCQLINKKSADLVLEIYHNDLDFCSLTEMWIKLDDSTTPITLCPPGYKILSVPRDDRVGGWVALVHREEIPVTHNAMYNYESLECSHFKVSLNSFNLNLAVIYLLPSKSVLDFTKDILDFMKKNITASGKTLLTGNFNIKVNDCSSNDTELLMELLDSLGVG